MNYPTLVFPSRFTALSKPRDTLSYFQQNPLTVKMFTYDHIDSYDSLLLRLSTYAGQVRWLLMQDLDNLESNDPDVLSPILLLCRDARYLKSCLKVYEYVRRTEPYVVLVTTPEIALRNATQLYGVLHCSENPDIELTIQTFCTTLLAPMMLPAIIGIDYVDIAGLIVHKEGRMLLATGKHESDPLAAISDALTSLKNRLTPKPKAKYVIGYLAHNSQHTVGLAEFKTLQNGLYELFGDEVENILAVLECDEDVYCGLMLVV